MEKRLVARTPADPSTDNQGVELYQEKKGSNPGQYYVERANLFDVRIGKVLHFRRTQLNASLGIHNLFNRSPILLQTDSHAGWQTPLQLMSPRLFKPSFADQF